MKGGYLFVGKCEVASPETGLYVEDSWIVCEGLNNDEGALLWGVR